MGQTWGDKFGLTWSSLVGQTWGDQALQFPDADLNLIVLAAFGADLTADPDTWVYTDISDRLLDDPANAKHGRSDGSGAPEPASFSCMLDNPDGALTKGNPASPYWPYLRKNTPVKAYINGELLFDGYAVGWTPTWSVWAQQPAVMLTAAGSLQRLGQGNPPLRSALARSIIASGPVSYWSMEDGSTATQIAEPAGGQTMRLVGDFGLGLAPSLGGSAALATPATGSMAVANVAPFPGSWVPSASGWSVLWVANIPRQPATDTLLMEWYSADTAAAHWQVFVTATGNVVLRLYNSAGIELLGDTGFGFDQFPTGSAYGRWLLWSVFYTNSLGDALIEPSWQDATYLLANSLLLPGHFPGQPTTVGVQAPANSADNFSVGHLAVQPFVTFLNGHAAYGYPGETATDRLTRLCLEEKVPLAITETSTTTMGPQGVDSFVNLLRECEDADGGNLYDGLSPGIGYIARAARYNVASKMLVDYSTIRVTESDDQVLVPADDDQQIRNQWKVGRKNGSSETAVDEDGPLGTAAVGLYESSITLNIDSDSDLPNQAAWRVRLGTVEGLRYPQVTLDLAANPDLIPDWLGLGLLDRFTKTNLPAQHPPGDVDLNVVGRRQTISRRSWLAVANCSPYQPWTVGALNTTFRLEMAAQTLAADLVPGATTLSLATAAGHALFTLKATYPNDFPPNTELLLDVGGWTIRVTDATGGASPQTLTIDAAPNTDTIPSGTAITLWRPAALAL